MRRKLRQSSGSAVGGGRDLAVALTAGEAEAKIAQAAVKYQQEPKDGKQCDGCNFFIAPNACKQVDGEIFPTGYCLLWVKKAS